MTTKHTHKGSFGRLVDGCPRCDELARGAKPVSWQGDKNRRDQEQRDAEHRAHFAPGGPHQRGTCGPVCTFGEW
ncbi:hypothetical protein [Streptomyces sp. NPDC051994]|uniref:hypothetical protein n=1 Tax=unclassified Streptomyces TaxID=2593676 RepID=UPI00342FB24D